MVTPFEVVGAMSHEEGGQFAINAAYCPGFWNADDPWGVFPKEGAEIFDIFCENDAALETASW